MKKITLFITLILTIQVSWGQKTSYFNEPEKLFNHGKEMFLESNYVGAAEQLLKFSELSADEYLKEEAAYMVAVSSFYNGDNNRGSILMAFLESYPETVHRNELNFFVASYYYDIKEWETACRWFNISDLDYLSVSQQEHYSFRNGYSQMKLGNHDEAIQFFGLLSQNSKTYHNAANYYLGYIEYSNGNYKKALQYFNMLRGQSEYAEEVAFYKAQSTFFDGNLNEAIQLSNAYIEEYPNNKHNPEINRILGNSHFRLGQITRAIPYYEKYLEKISQPLRGDAYFIGLSYFESSRYNDAVNMFQSAIGESDELSQNAQLHLGQSYLRLNQKQLAQMAFEAASRDRFNLKVRETAMFNYALLSHETNFSVFSESITLFDNFLDEFPNSEYTDQVNDILAETFLTTKDYQAALNSINRIKQSGRRILEAKQMVLFQLGAQEFINGNMNKAIQYFNGSIGMGNYDVNARNSAYYWRGETFYRMGNYTSATNDFKQFTQNASSADINYSLGWYNLGYSLFKQHLYPEAIKSFLNFVASENNRSKPEYADALNRIGDSYYFNRHFADAERYYAQAADANHSSADYAAFQRAFVMGLQHNYQGKITALDNLMREYPNSQYFDDALYEKSRSLTMLNREHEAIEVLQRMVTEFPKSPLASQGGVQLGQLYHNTGNHQRSIDAYKNVISNFPGSDDAKNALISLETVYRDMNDIDSYVRYANSVPGGVRITPSRQDSLNYLSAESIYMRGSRQEAQTAMTKYLQSYPNGAYSSDANYYLGLIADEQGNTNLAMTYFRKVIDASSIKFLDNALIYTSKTEYNNGNYRQALADYSRLSNSTRNVSNKQVGQMGMVKSHTHLGNYHEAAKTATDLLSSGDLSVETVTEVYYLRGKAYKEINEIDKAILDFEHISNDTRSIYGAEAQFILADTYYSRKSYDKAESQVKDFMKKGTPHQYWMARALIVLADTYKAKGDDFQARQYIESLRNNYKGNEEDILKMISERVY